MADGSVASKEDGHQLKYNQEALFLGSYSRIQPKEIECKSPKAHAVQIFPCIRKAIGAVRLKEETPLKASKLEEKEETRREKWVLLSIALALLIFVGLFSLLSTQSFLCGSCHTIEKNYLSLNNSSHKDTSCFSCHREPGVAGFMLFEVNLLRMTASSLSQLYEKPIIAYVSDSSCLGCHRKIKKGIAVRNGIKISHKELSPGEPCTECHNTIPHGDAVKNKKYGTMEKCTACHNGQDAASDCQVCHEKNVKITKRRTGPWQVVHGSKWARTHGMGNLSSCSLCHAEKDCGKCHSQMPHTEDWPYSHGKKAKKTGLDKCYKCHNESVCQECHWLEMPHGDRFLPDHPKIYKEKGKKVCFNCHVKYDCDFCHSRHIHRAVAFPKNLVPKKIK